MSKKGVYKLDFSVGRQGDLTGVFIATDEQVEVLLKEDIQVYFGEVMGKHSEVYGPIDEGEIILITEEKKVVDMVEEFELSTGYDPFTYQSIGFDYETNGIEYNEEYEEFQVEELVNEIIKRDKK